MGESPESLFNGKDTAGWAMVGPGRFIVENGMLKTEGGMGLLWYKGRKFGNETVRVVFKTTGPRDNAGVFIRLPDAPVDPFYGVHFGYEVQIDAGGDDWHSTGAIYSLSKVTRRAQKPAGEWNTLDIQLDGPTTRVTLNGELVNEFQQSAQVPERKQWYEPVRGPRPDYGYIGLQNHDANSTVYFREVSVITPGAVISKSDRERLQSYMSATFKQVLDSIHGLSPEQLNYKSAPEKWSVAEVVEHLIHAEPALFDRFLSSLRTVPATGAKSAITDEMFIARIKDRTQRAEAPPALRPAGRWTAASGMAEEFKSRRVRTLEWLREARVDLRGRIIKSPFGEIDAYQQLMLLPAHTERHLLQIQEVKGSPGFPKR